MADWNKIGDRGNVEDRRSSRGLVGGGLGLGGIAIVLLFSYLQTGTIDPGTVIDILSQSNVVQQEQTVATDDTYDEFASTVLGSTNRVWTDQFATRGLEYSPPRLVLFRGGTESGCGGAYSEVGPHYCPSDLTIYLDETFFNELQVRFGGNTADVAQAYVIGHEVGHHVQDLLNVNLESVALELQADCLAGAWLNSLKSRGILETNEIEEALGQAASVGDDNIQQRTTGTINKETWTHGSSAERVASFEKGYDGGTLATCDL